MKTIISMILIAVMLFAATLAEDVSAVRVGDITYTAEEVQLALNSMLQTMYTSTEEVPTEEERHAAAESILDSYVLQGVLENECKRLRLDSFSNDELYDMRSQAQKQYDEVWQEIRHEYSAEEISDADITAYLTQCGVTLDTCFKALRLETMQDRYIEKKKIIAEVTDEEVIQYYEDNMVQPYREIYENDIPLFEEEVLYGDAVSLYIPDGYRLIRQIILDIPDNLNERMASLQALAEEKLAESEEAYDEIARLALAGENAEQARQRYQEANSAREQAMVDYNLTWSEVLPALSETTDEIFARLDTGESFANLVPLYCSTDYTYYWHPDSTAWPDKLKTAVLRLNAPGDVSAPMMMDDGVHILYYDSDIDGGADELTPEHMELVRLVAEYQAKIEKLQEVLSSLRENYNVQTNIDLLQY